MAKYKFAMIGSGWRADFFARAARELPDIFEITSVMARHPEKAKSFKDKWNVPIVTDIDAVLASKPDFVVLTVPREVMPEYILRMTAAEMPVLAETPPGKDIEALNDLFTRLPAGAKVEVAEQYQFQPMHAARLNVVRSGEIGMVTHAQVSCAHGYHGISMIRKMLGVTFEDAAITAFSCNNPIMYGPGRDGQAQSEVIENEEQVIAFLDFGGKQAVFDFAGSQYMHYIRENRMLARGERGELNGNHVNYMKRFDDPVFYNLERKDMGQDGNLEGFFLKGIMGEGKWLYKNPFPLARLYDDEIAVATCLMKMGEYVKGGKSFYSVNEAAQDLYLDLLIQQSLAGNSIKVQSAPQIWVK
ncbi:MAG: Gfo/Idh/MocA family oxidoreductase [Oscillospiraceae bacterium]|nr:Gfo/Idh/MocA family oxidoreductase [Oscillospiraceae bacterium]